MHPEISRRSVIAAGGAVALAAATSSCAVYGQSTEPDADAGSRAAGPNPLGPTTEVPVGGGTIFADAQVVVTQPTAGTFKCFSAVCTHQGCMVADVTDGTINCPCHGSKFAVADGAVVDGPAPTALRQR